MKVLAALLLMTAVAAARPAAGSRAIVDRPVVIVGGEPIWKSEVDDAIKAAKAEASPDVFQRVLDDLIEQHLMMQAADAAHITVSDAEVEAGVKQIEQQNNIDDSGLATALAEFGMTPAQYKVELAKQIKIQKVMQVELVPKISVRATESPMEFQMQLENERRKWVEARKRSVHIERRQ